LAVLQQHGFAASEVRFQLTAPLPTHAHLTQWRESDLQFISRLAAEAGLFYQCVVEEADKAVLLFGDNLEHYGRGRLLDVPLRQPPVGCGMTARHPAMADSPSQHVAQRAPHRFQLSDGGYRAGCRAGF
jgi:uncharacterized protein involved in type VI secretion and phage assembly